MAFLKDIDSNEQKFLIKGPQLLNPLRSRNGDTHIIFNFKKANYKTVLAKGNISTILYF